MADENPPRGDATAEARAQSPSPPSEAPSTGGSANSAGDASRDAGESGATASTENEPATEPDAEDTEPSIQPQTKVAPSPGLRTIDAEEDVVIVDLLHDHYYRLNPTGSFIWRRLVEHDSMEEIAEALADKYELSGHEALEYVLEFVRQLREKGVAAPVQ